MCHDPLTRQGTCLVQWRGAHHLTRCHCVIRWFWEWERSYLCWMGVCLAGIHTAPLKPLAPGSLPHSHPFSETPSLTAIGPVLIRHSRWKENPPDEMGSSLPQGVPAARSAGREFVFKISLGNAVCLQHPLRPGEILQRRNLVRFI